MKETIDSRQLLAFATLARKQSFTLAAKELFLTQSAVSHAIKALEEELETRLFNRIGKRVHLTQAGEQLLRHAERILREMQDARTGLEELRNWGHGRLRIGASLTACQYLLPSVLREFRLNSPRCKLRIETGDAQKMEEMLRCNQIDLAIMIEPRDDDITFRRLFEDELRFLVSPLHPWAQQGAVARSGIADETIILYSKNSQTFRMVSEYFLHDHIPLNQVMELGSMESIKELVKIGLGVGVVAPWIVQRELSEASLVSFPLGDRPLRRVWGVAHLRGRSLTLAEETFAGLCERAAEKLGLQAGVVEEA
ncbi:MAG: LysR family transcriptional regulator [Opitutaceae bacterium]|nr:LysR family transcriptional regulator [Opitutaceae bacterium]